ncbi:MAG TPA: LysR family transcriptional regulator [Gammaproteobacteria bacterium]|jgi:DNA-binding transcriptional LysR family regulator|nr:LysR family transcriptional regulator [Gammaproteobacteria bacterium]
MDLIDGLRAFVATAQSGSFTEAAHRLSISNRLTSKYVAELEKRIGARLLQRTTRKVGLTPIGEDLLARAPALLEELDDMLSAVAEDASSLSGVLRLSAPVTFGERMIRELLGHFAAEHPGLAIDLHLSDAFVDLATGGFDLAFRVGELDTASLKVRKLGEIHSQLVASPTYLAHHATPRTPADLSHHSCIIDSNSPDPTRWTLRSDDDRHIVTPPHQLTVNSARVARDWALDGYGIALCPDFVLDEALANGQLVPLLNGYQPPSYPINAVYLAGSVLPHKVRALIDYAIAHFQANAHHGAK